MLSITVADSSETTPANFCGRLESAYSLLWGSHRISGKGVGDTLNLL